MLLPAVLLVLAVVGVLVSSFQIELGLMTPGKGERAAVAARTVARDLSVGAGTDEYSIFGRTLLVATIAREDAAPTNAADVRVDHLLANALDCLQALREAWQAECDGIWDDEVHGSPRYWNSLHPCLNLSEQGPLTPETVRKAARAAASKFIERALDMVD
jgi:hypothetical protein